MGEVGAKRSPPDVELEALVLPCSPYELPKVRSFVEQAAHEHGVPDGELARLVAATDEAAMNAVDHGASLSAKIDFVVSLGAKEKCLVILVKDHGGKHFDPEYFQEISQKKTWGLKGGRGILLISRAMDEVMYLFDRDTSTTVCMVKYLDGDS
jgi:anti-sigma regulatory factor (Ser/Thr protein kinase)